MTVSVTGRNRRFGHSAHLMRGFRKCRGPTHWHTPARSPSCLSVGSRIGADRRLRARERASERGRSSRPTMNGNLATRAGIPFDGRSRNAYAPDAPTTSMARFYRRRRTSTQRGWYGAPNVTRERHFGTRLRSKRLKSSNNGGVGETWCWESVSARFRSKPKEFEEFELAERVGVREFASADARKTA